MSFPKHFFFVGIAGSGMAPLAETLLSQGLRVSGSDLCLTNLYAKNLAEKGAKLYDTHNANNLDSDVDCLVYSSAIKQDNPEFKEAIKRGIKIIRRAEALSEIFNKKNGIAVAGAHGKTSTASMLAVLLANCNYDPTAVIGGYVQQFNSNARIGKSDLVVIEADESDGSFLSLKPKVNIITNVDEEHLEAYKDKNHLIDSFCEFANYIPEDGLNVICLEDEKLRSIYQRISSPKISYGFSKSCDWYATLSAIDSTGSAFSVYKQSKFFGDFKISLIGEHYVLNALAVIIVADFMGIPPKEIAYGLEGFQGVSRRMEVLGNLLDSGARLISDYAHHPTEIAATIKAARQAYSSEESKIKVIFQPHRFSRTKDCWNQFLNCFSDCSDVIITDIYAAGESPILDISSERLVREVNHPSVKNLAKLDQAFQCIKEDLKSQDTLMLLGAGDIGYYATSLKVSR